MAECIDSRIVKVRKRHNCQGCGKIIAVGEQALLSSIADAWDIWHFYECPECTEYVKNECQKCKDNEICIAENYYMGLIKECKKERIR